MAYTGLPQWVDATVNPDGSITGTTPVTADELNKLDQGIIDTNNDVMTFLWDGAKYVTASGVLLTATDASKAREVYGPTDPALIAGVVVGGIFAWNQYS